MNVDVRLRLLTFPVVLLVSAITGLIIKINVRNDIIISYYSKNIQY